MNMRSDEMDALISTWPLPKGPVMHIPWHAFMYHSGTRYIEGLEPNQVNRIHVLREVVPIIFVPGVMGSVLLKTSSRGKSEKEVIWNPSDQIWMVFKYGLPTAVPSAGRVWGDGER